MKFVDVLLLLPLCAGLLQGAAYFEPNRGQSHTNAMFIGRSPSGLASLEPGKLRLRSTNGAAIDVELESTEANARGESVEPIPGVSHYALGRDPSSWIYGVPHFAAVQFRGVYQGIDLRYHFSGNDVEFDFDAAPDADISRIHLRFAEDIRLSAEGDLVLKEGRVRRPVAWQTIGGKRQYVQASFRRIGRRRAGFRLGPHDSAEPVLIDPTIDFATFLGGSSAELDTRLAVDNTGNIYMAGTTFSADFPASKLPGSALNVPVSLREGDVYVTRLKPDASAIDWSFFIGGTASERCAGIALDALGDVYIYGATVSANFPVTPGAWRATIDPSLTDTFVAKFDAQTGTLIAGTYLGFTLNTGYPNPLPGGGFAVDAAGGVYAGGTPGALFQATPGAYSSSPKDPPGIRTTFGIVRLNAGLTNPVYATYLWFGSPQVLRADATGNLVFSGNVDYSNPPFPGVNPIAGISQVPGDSGPGFIAKLNASGSSLVYASLFSSAITDLQIDGSGNVWATGLAGSKMPQVNPLALDPAPAGPPPSDSRSAFLAEIPPEGGHLLQSTLFYGPSYPAISFGSTSAPGLVFPAGRLCLTGLPIAGQTPGGLGTVNPVAQISTLVCADESGTRIGFRSALPGAAYGYTAAQATPDGAVLFAGGTSQGFQTTPGVVQPLFGGAYFTNDLFLLSGGDAFLMRVSLPNPAPKIAAVYPDSIFINGSNNYSTNGSTNWSFNLYGTGFGYGEQITWNGQSAPAAAYNSPTQITVAGIAPAAVLPGPNQIVATMAAPGGGVSNAGIVTGYNPAPSPSVSPATVTAGAPETKVIISGPGLLASSVVNWNGSVRAATFVPVASPGPLNSGYLQFLLEPAELAQPSVAVVTVSNPGPGGGVSAALRFVVQAASGTGVPAIAGPGLYTFNESTPDPATITLSGSGFTVSTVATWDGAAVPVSLVSATQLRITPPPGSLSILGTHSLQAANGSLVSNVLRLFVARAVDSYLSAFDPTNQILYTLARPSSPQSSSALFDLVIYDARTGKRTGRVAGILTNPSALVLSDDGRYVYIAGGETNLEVKRFDTITEATDLDFQVQLPATVVQGQISAIATVAGSPQTIAVVAGKELLIYDNDRPRPLSSQLVTVPAYVWNLFATAGRVFLLNEAVYPCLIWWDFDSAGVESSSGQCGTNPPELVSNHGFAWLTSGSRRATVSVPYGAGSGAQAYYWTVDPTQSVAYSVAGSGSSYQVLQMDLNTLQQTVVYRGSVPFTVGALYIANDGTPRLVSSSYLAAP